MKVKCIDAEDSLGELEEGIIYTVTEESDSSFMLEGGYPRWSKSRFEVVPEVNLPPMTGEYKEAVQRMLDNFNTKPITYKDFLASMPKSASAYVTMYGDGEVIANVYGFEFVCKTEERAEEVYTALITLFKEDV